MPKPVQHLNEGEIIHGYRFNVDIDGDGIGIYKIGFSTFYPDPYSYRMRARLKLERALVRERKTFLDAAKSKTLFRAITVTPNDRVEGAPITWAQIKMLDVVAIGYEVNGLDAMNSDVVTEVLVLESDLWSIGE